MNIDGYHVPAETTVMVMFLFGDFFIFCLISISFDSGLLRFITYVMARSEEYFKDASEFKPERFMKDKDLMETK